MLVGCWLEYYEVVIGALAFLLAILYVLVFGVWKGMRELMSDQVIKCDLKEFETDF